ncbi:transglutaminase domain-containing protein [Paenibacillus sp. SI8]|uniref:transglutaminase domain-containing protein n=1 Tax=unclassified Paenibacillus TaxID=185978 RepID=UPI003467EBA6
MKAANIDKIKELGHLFRNAIEKLEKSEFSSSTWFENFPRGCCGDTSDLFAKYLLTLGIQTEYVWGINSKRQSHGWLEYEDYIMDLTADQFHEISERVLITREGIWYQQFKGQRRSIHDFEKFSDFNSLRLGKIYGNVIKRLEL